MRSFLKLPHDHIVYGMLSERGKGLTTDDGPADNVTRNTDAGDESRTLLASIDISTVVGPRGRALIALLLSVTGHPTPC